MQPSCEPTESPVRRPWRSKCVDLRTRRERQRDEEKEALEALEVVRRALYESGTTQEFNPSLEGAEMQALEDLPWQGQHFFERFSVITYVV